MIKSNNGSLPITRAHTETSKTSIPLSNSVAVINSKSKQLQLLYPLEDTYRARYKSDYFPQNGQVRKPRYVADTVGNHFVTLKMPSDYINVDLTDKYVRVAWITTVQQCDDNTMNLRLVLIKSKLDQLKNVAPLKLFDLPSDSFDETIAKVLIPKKLIETYKLEKSQLAFTLCTKN